MRLFWKSVILMVAIVLIVPGNLTAPASAAGDNVAEARVAGPVPQWKVNDYWRYEYKQRVDHFQAIYLHEGVLTSIAEFSGTKDYYQHQVVTGTTGDYYQLNCISETWQNGTYILCVSGYPPSGEGTYRIHYRNVSVTPDLIRRSDLNVKEFQRNTTWEKEYSWTIGYPSYEIYDEYGSELMTSSCPSGPVSFHKFPLDFSQSWVLDGSIIEQHIGYKKYEYGYVATYNYTDTVGYTNASASTGADYDTQNCPDLPLFTDCCRINLTGNYNFTRTGVEVNYIGQIISLNESRPDEYLETSRWYSRRAGNIVNYNSTSSSNGLRLTAYRHDYIPPNYAPVLEMVAGAPASASAPVEVAIREGEPTAIELKVRDENANDVLDWKVVRIDGAGNPEGAVLMNGVPNFTVSNPTKPDAFNIHANKLLVTAEQPRTADEDVYTVTVNVNDNKEDGSTNFTFKIRVLNVNDAPEVVMAVPDVWVRENATLGCTTVKLTEVFQDRDVESGIPDLLSYTAAVSSGPRLDIAIDNSTGVVTINAPDYSEDKTPPDGWESTVGYSCTDSGAGNPASQRTTTAIGKVHVEHVNHDSRLTPNGTDIVRYGLTWGEDSSDSRLDLNKAFYDPDTRYAKDSLAFTWSGNANIRVNETAGRVTLTPNRDWNGGENITFMATDESGWTSRLDVDCIVLPVPDAPCFCETGMAVTRDNAGALTIKEAAGPGGPLTTLKLAVNVTDADELLGAADPHSCRWWVYDNRGTLLCATGNFAQKDDRYDFRCNWTGQLSSQLGPYQVKCVARDSYGLTAAYLWNVTVLDVNRPPVPSIDRPLDNRTFSRGANVLFDAWNSSDPDESRENLTFIWRSSKQGLLNQDTGEAGARFSARNLRSGKHVITLTVQDSKGCETSAKFTIMVAEPGQTPGFGGLILMASVAVMAAFLKYRRRNRSFLGIIN